MQCYLDCQTISVSLAFTYWELPANKKLPKVSRVLRMETELFASVEAGDLDKFKELIKKETKETIDQVIFLFRQYYIVLNTREVFMH